MAAHKLGVAPRDFNAIARANLSQILQNGFDFAGDSGNPQDVAARRPPVKREILG